MAASGGRRHRLPSPALPRQTRGHRAQRRIARRLRQRLPLLRLAVGRDARRLVVPRMAPRGARRLYLRRLQQLAAHRDPHAPRFGGRLERLLPRGDVPRPPHPRLTLQDPRPRRQRLDGPHPGLCHARGAGRHDEGLHGPVLGPGRAVRLARRRIRRLAGGQPADLRGPRGHGPGARRGGHLPRIHREDPAHYKKGRLQRRAADGHRRAPLLRLVRLPRLELLRPLVALRNPRGAQGAHPPGPRTGAGGHHGPRARPLREEPQRGDQRT